jgi:hypothetical protein
MIQTWLISGIPLFPCWHLAELVTTAQFYCLFYCITLYSNFPIAFSFFLSGIAYIARYSKLLPWHFLFDLSFLLHPVVYQVNYTTSQTTRMDLAIEKIIIAKETCGSCKESKSRKSDNGVLEPKHGPLLLFPFSRS